MKSWIFTGCSFTWGQGLWSYYKTDKKIPTVQEYITLNYPIPEDALQFRDSVRWPGLVSSHFGVDWVIKRHNGGTDEESLRFIWEVKENNVGKNTLLTHNVEWDNVEYIILQTTQLYRSPFTFFYKGEEYNLLSEYDMPNLTQLDKVIRQSDRVGDYRHITQPNFDIFYNWMIENNYKIEDFQTIHLNHMVDEIEKTFKKLEAENKKPIVWSWTSEYYDEILKRDFFKDKFVRLTYKNKEYNCLEDIMSEYPELIIGCDPEVINFSDSDGHPSLKAQRLIADSIINFIQSRKDLENG
jgi:hypothetical protein